MWSRARGYREVRRQCRLRQTLRERIRIVETGMQVLGEAGRVRLLDRLHGGRCREYVDVGDWVLASDPG